MQVSFTMFAPLWVEAHVPGTSLHGAIHTLLKEAAGHPPVWHIPKEP